MTWTKPATVICLPASAAMSLVSVLICVHPTLWRTKFQTAGFRDTKTDRPQNRSSAGNILSGGDFRLYLYLISALQTEILSWMQLSIHGFIRPVSTATKERSE